MYQKKKKTPPAPFSKSKIIIFALRRGAPKYFLSTYFEHPNQPPPPPKQFFQPQRANILIIYSSLHWTKRGLKWKINKKVAEIKSNNLIENGNGEVQ